MSGVYRFEDLRVWQAAKRQSDLVATLLLRPPFRGDRALSDHMNDAALSVMFNISEGFLRRRDGEATELIALNESIARMLRRWRATLEPSDRNRNRGDRERRRRRTKDEQRTKDQGLTTS